MRKFSVWSAKQQLTGSKPIHSNNGGNAISYWQEWRSEIYGVWPLPGSLSCPVTFIDFWQCLQTCHSCAKIAYCLPFIKFIFVELEMLYLEAVRRVLKPHFRALLSIFSAAIYYFWKHKGQDWIRPSRSEEQQWISLELHACLRA